MMILLTAILGFLSSTLPSFMRYFEAKQRFKYEIQLAALQLEATIKNVDAAKDIAEAKAILDDSISARNLDRDIDGGKFINFLRASVRPVITYSFFSLYFGVKLVAAYIILQNDLTIANVEAATLILLDETTISIIVMVIGFYFGSRAMINKDKN